MAAKLPKGELPKRTSGYADYLKERRPKISKSEAAAQAGAVRERGFDTSEFKKTQAKAPVKAKQAERKDPVSKVIQDITNRYRVTAREARDIVTAVGTVANLSTNKDAASNKNVGVSRTTEVKKAISGVKKQVSETVKAAKTGKSGTTAAEVSTRRGEKPLVYGDTKKRR
jgi:hypothetical protein